jgi:hypothetical protein
MLRKLIALALIAAGVAAALKKRSQSAETGTGGTASSPAPSTDATPATGNAPAADVEDLQEVRAGQTEATIQAPIAGAGGDEEAVIPDVSDDDPLVREQEAAAAQAAGAVGGEADTVTADVDPEMRPVYEGSGGEPETLETTEEQGR